MCSADIFLAALAILLPPVPVWIKAGFCSADFVINVVLCFFAWLPGVLHAWYIIAKYPEPDYEYEQLPEDREPGRVTYIFVRGDDSNNNNTGGGTVTAPPAQQSGMSYGATGSRNDATAGGSSAGGQAPPSYAQVVAGDNKVQN